MTEALGRPFGQPACGPADPSPQAVSTLAGNDQAQEEATALPAPVSTSLASVWAQAEDNHRRYSDTGDRENDIRFLTLGLTGEAGEVANFVKKRWRDGDGHDEAIRLEIADVCAYAFMLASAMGMSPDDLMGVIAYKQGVFVRKMRLRDSDGSPKGGDGEAGSVHDSAGPQGIAQ